MSMEMMESVIEKSDREIRKCKGEMRKLNDNLFNEWFATS
jgi:hypothetical protein